jgi:hypothetical protein
MGRPEIVVKSDERSPLLESAGSSVWRSHRRFSVSAAARITTIISGELTCFGAAR